MLRDVLRTFNRDVATLCAISKSSSGPTKLRRTRREMPELRSKAFVGRIASLQNFVYILYGYLEPASGSKSLPFGMSEHHL